MKGPLDPTSSRARTLRGVRFGLALAGCIVAAGGMRLSAQTPSAAPSQAAPRHVPEVEVVSPPRPADSAVAPTFSSPPVAIVPLDKSLPGAALTVAGSMQAWNGRAYITGSGSIAAGSGTALVMLPYRGTLRVCASSSVKLAADSSTPAGEVPGLLIALDRGAVEMSFAASTARARNADTLLTPFFRILVGGPSAAEVKVRLGDNGDTCVDNAGANAPYVVVSSVFEGGVYRVQAGQRVMFEHGSLHEVVDQEKEPCGCPPRPKPEANEFPMAQSAGLTPDAAMPLAPEIAGRAPNPSDALVYNGADHGAQAAAPAAAPRGQAQAASSTQKPGAGKKPGFFGRIGHFFKRVFGAE